MTFNDNIDQKPSSISFTLTGHLAEIIDQISATKIDDTLDKKMGSAQ
ncbi:hypothetical protein VIB_000054 [Vibrio metschnikovii CIP 69.14]|nr:hypothetical protein VIB_000054 [Vibrio metschnikovii CIP 69.14]